MTMLEFTIPFYLLCLTGILAVAEPIPLPPFQKLKSNYPGYWNFGGRFHNHHLIKLVGTHSNLLLHDTSALRLSYAFNKIGGDHSLGKDIIRLSKYGTDSVPGKDTYQYIYHPIAYGPFMADKYGYPTVSKLHQMDPIDTKKNFWGKQGILRVITYTKKLNRPKGHVALWDCNHFYQSKDWIAGHSLITVEFWETPDSDCSYLNKTKSSAPMDTLDMATLPPNFNTLIRHKTWRKQFVKKFFLEKMKDNEKEKL